MKSNPESKFVSKFVSRNITNFFVGWGSEVRKSIVQFPVYVKGKLIYRGNEEKDFNYIRRINKK